MSLPPLKEPPATAAGLSDLRDPCHLSGRRAAFEVLLLPGVSGMLAFGALPQVDQGYLAWISCVGLLVFIGRCGTMAKACLGGCVFGLVQMAGLLLWVPAVMENYGGVPELGAWLLYGLLVGLQASYPAAACCLTRFLINRLGEKLLLLFPFVWVAFEYLETRFPFGGFPWMLIGYSQTQFSRLMQIADVTAVYGVSFLVISANTALAWFWIHKNSRFRRLWPAATAGLLLGVAVIYGEIAVMRWGELVADRTVAMLQQNISIDEPDAITEAKFRDGYVRMADQLQAGTVDMLILPESPSPLSFQYDMDYRKSIQQLARRYPLGVVFSNIAFSAEGTGHGYYNSAYWLDRDGNERGRYDKIHLVPFGEYVPMKKLFFFVESISKDVSDFQAGKEYVSLPIDGHPVSVLICFEAVFPRLVRQFVDRGATLLINLSNARWYGDSAAPYQHLAMARWRAVENRRYLLRATNSGISAVIDPIGRVRSRSRLMREDVCIGRFGFVAGSGFYTRYGDVFVFLCAIITACFLLVCFIRTSHRVR